MGFRWWLIETRAYTPKFMIFRNGHRNGRIMTSVKFGCYQNTYRYDWSRNIGAWTSTIKFCELPDNTALNSIDSLVNSTQVIARIKRPAGHVCPWQVDGDAFRWTIATMRLHDEEDACSYD
ncbi:hypothetical protein F2Q69_00027011 [Brassica cretica]|uniref:Uncharacterized protein n=1 Tax=Brassica cretica TaxID=69181 RepID=A0A8S9RXE4_BRACR|nr:hypothetical protein F2Q69_00027011 [Brassica cretica]